MKLLSYSLNTGYVDLVCQQKLLVIEMYVFRVNFGNSICNHCNVELQCLQHTIHKLMVCLKDSIDQYNKCCIVIVVVSSKSGVDCCLNVNLH